MYHYFTQPHTHQPPLSNRNVNRVFHARSGDAQTFHTFLKHEYSTYQSSHPDARTTFFARWPPQRAPRRIDCNTLTSKARLRRPGSPCASQRSPSPTIACRSINGRASSPRLRMDNCPCYTSQMAQNWRNRMRYCDTLDAARETRARRRICTRKVGKLRWMKPSRWLMTCSRRGVRACTLA